MSYNFFIDPDITKAETLPTSFYKDQDDHIFLKTWQWIGDENQVELSQTAHPFVLLDGYLTEPMVLTRDKQNNIHCLTNVCTHRGNMVILGSGKTKKLTCMYHGRRFNLQGEMEHMPEFKEAKNFPRPCDNLHKFPLKKWGPFLFALTECLQTCAARRAGSPRVPG